MSDLSNGMVSGRDAKLIFRERSRSYDTKTVSAAKKQALETKVLGEKQDGWEELKRNKKSVRLKKTKPDDRQLEDEIWCLLYRLGFKELNADRDLRITAGSGSPPRQIDVLAKDDETVFIVECTHSKDGGAKPVIGLIDKINGIREDVIKAVHTRYGKKPKLKVKWAIATRNIDWREADKKRAEDSKIAVITETDLAYYGKLLAILKEAARYQFLARYLKGEGVEGLKIEVPATRGKMGATSFYNFLISPTQLLKVAYISHKAAGTDDMDTYQRMIKPARLKDIGAFIDDGGQFPTNIVINFKSIKGSLNFQKMETFEDSTFGKLTLPGQYGVAWVIDGQHRLYGFAFAKKGEKHVVPVLAYENLPAVTEMNLFVDINSKQVKVPRSLLNELYANLNIESTDRAEQLAAIYSRIALRLDELSSSPIKSRVVTSATEKNSFRCLSLTSLIDGCDENRFLGTVQPPAEPGPLSHLSREPERSIDKAVAVIAGYLRLFAEGASQNWTLGDAKGGFLCTNNGLRALFRLLRQIITFVEDTQNVKASTMDPEDILEKVTPYVSPLAEFFKNADASEIHRFRSRQALHGVAQNCMGMMAIINEKKPEFTTKDLANYTLSRDKDGTIEARGLIDAINTILHNDVIATLRNKYASESKSEAWWWDGVPESIREKCSSQMNRDKGEKRVEQYLALADYQTIVSHNWPLFSNRYGFGPKPSKADQTSWIGKLNKIRQTTHHPEKGLISKEEVKIVRQIYEFVHKKIGPAEPSAKA
jgi:DNA sulfur modification protein DndB